MNGAAIPARPSPVFLCRFKVPKIFSCYSAAFCLVTERCIQLHLCVGKLCCIISWATLYTVRWTLQEINAWFFVELGSGHIYIDIAVVIYRYTCTKWHIQFVFHLAHPYICLVCLMLSLNLASFITCSKFPFIILSDIQFLSNDIFILFCRKK